MPHFHIKASTPRAFQLQQHHQQQLQQHHQQQLQQHHQQQLQQQLK